MSNTDLPREEALARLAQGLKLVALRSLADLAEAEDAAQETLTRLLVVLNDGGVPPDYTLSSYAYGILRHVVADLLRSRKRFSLLSRSISADGHSPLELLVSSERAAALSRALEQLPLADRKLLERCFVHGERVVDIAAETREPAERVRKRKSRALDRLRELLERSQGHVLSDWDDNEA